MYCIAFAALPNVESVAIIQEAEEAGEEKGKKKKKMKKKNTV